MDIVTGRIFYGETVERIVKGGIYHVIARGNNKEYIFKENVDKGYFIKQIKETTAGMGYKVFGFVLMDNHYHIIVQTFDKKLQDIMHQINNKHSKCVFRRHPDNDTGIIRTAYRNYPDTVSETSGHLVELTN